jgi:hypothetical protein
MDALTNSAARFLFGSFCSRGLANGVTPPTVGETHPQSDPYRLPSVHSAQVELIGPFDPQAKPLANWKRAQFPKGSRYPAAAHEGLVKLA